MFRGFYEKRVFPWLNDALGGAPALQKMRRETLESAAGDVIEIGFGSGANLPFYPTSVTRVTGVEPNAGMTERALERVRASTVPVRSVEGMAESLPFGDGEFDTAVSTLTLCSVRSPGQVLSELHRVVRSGGALLVLEHGLSEDAQVVRWQQRLNGIQNLVACGCNLNRPIVGLVTAAGFRFETLRTFFVPGVPRPLGWITAGRAIRS